MCETSLVLKKITKKMFNITRNAHCWLGGYIINRLENAIRFKPNGPIHIFFSICDHFEPLWQNASFDEGLRRVKFWHNHYPAIADKHKDADGQKPKYTFFYPEEEYHEEYLDLLADLAKRGYGEVEIHLHHNNDTSDNLEEINDILDNYTFIDFVAVSSKNYSSTRNVFLKLVKFDIRRRYW